MPPKAALTAAPTQPLPAGRGIEFVEVFTTRPDTIFGASFVAVAADHPIAQAVAGADPEAAAFIAECQRGRHQRGRNRDGREEGLSHAGRGGPSARSRVAAAGLHRELRADGLWHRRDLRRARPRSARLRIREPNISLPIRRVVAPGADLASEPIVDDAEIDDRNRGQLALSRRADDRAGGRRGHPPRRSRRLGQGHDRLPPARLGRVAPALLGHADPDHPLRGMRRGAGAARPAAGGASRGRRASTCPATRSTGIRRWKHVDCPSCGGAATRETDTLDTFVDSSLVLHPLRQPAGGPAVRPRRGRGVAAGRRNISAGSSMRSCTCSTRASGPARCSSSAGSTSPSRSRACSRKAWSPTRPIAPATAAGSAPTRSRANGDDWVHIESGQPVTAGRIEKMSKSKRNTIDPEPILAKYGADAVRWFMLSDSPPERDLEWSEAGIEGASRFVQRVWRLAATRLPRRRQARTRRSSASSTAPSPRSAKRSTACSSTRRSRSSTS